MKVSDFNKYCKGGHKDLSVPPRAERRERAKEIYRAARRAKKKAS